jgi:hypothetical protein
VSLASIVIPVVVELVHDIITSKTDELKTKAKAKLAAHGIDVDDIAVKQQLAALLDELPAHFQLIVDEFAKAEARGKAHPLGGGYVEFIECCSCSEPEFLTEPGTVDCGDDCRRCTKCGKPEFTRTATAATTTTE